MRPLYTFLIISAIILAIDFYVWQGVSFLIRNMSPRAQRIIRDVYWGFTAANFLLFVALRFGFLINFHRATMQLIFAFTFAVLLAKIVWALFLIMDDAARLVRWIWANAFSGEGELNPSRTKGIDRLKFFSQAGLLLGGGLVTAMTWGIVKGAHNYKVRRRELRIAGLPDAFDGLKIAQLSDIHAGSFWSYNAVERGVNMVLEEKPDMVFFTGDLVNDRADEMDDWKELFGRITAPMGVFSVLGNHDYGDYVVWPSAEAKEANLAKLAKTHADMGWQLLRNEHKLVTKGDSSLAVVGVENWSNKARFPKYGRLDTALAGTEAAPVRLLLSHDPSHWKAQVLDHNLPIHATFSGHTHGMQFGVDVKHYRWSPVKYMYREWLDLYEENGRYLYVNRGFGYLGYPGRLGMHPEVSVFTLRKA
ncbi:MAG: metallophosphoesterase [Bacteroidia bacterium]